MFAIDTGPLSLAARARIPAGAAPPPPPPPPPPPQAIGAIVIEGDSITSGAPSSPNGSYGYQFGDSRPDKTITVRAQNSRSIGGPDNLDDDSNTLFGNVAEDAAYAPNLIAFKIGANDFSVPGGTTAAQYRSRLIALRGAYAAARPAMKIAWSPPLAYNPTGTPHPGKAWFDAQRATLLAECRDPAVWGQWADVYLPLGEHPDFADLALAAPLFGDSVHPSTAGQAALFAVYKPMMDSLLDTSRAGSSTIYPAAWIGGETNLAVNAQIVRRIIVAGLAPGGTALGASVSGGGGAQLRVGGRAWGSSVGTGAANGHRLYNGDVLELRLTTSANNDTPVSIALSIGSETRTLTFRTVAEVTPAAFTQGGTAQKSSGGGTAFHTFDAIAFPAAGTGLIAVYAGDGLPAPTGVTWNGAACSEVLKAAGWYALSLWRVPVNAGTAGDVAVHFDRSVADSVISYGTLTDAHPVPTAAIGGTVGTDAHPSYPSPAAPVPASGIAIAFMGQDGSAPLATGSVTTGTQVASATGATVNGMQIGIVSGTRTTGGAIVFNSPRYDDKRIGIAVFKAAGT